MFESKDTLDDNGVVGRLPNKCKKLLSINALSKVQLPTHCVLRWEPIATHKAQEKMFLTEGVSHPGD